MAHKRQVICLGKRGNHALIQFVGRMDRHVKSRIVRARVTLKERTKKPTSGGSGVDRIVMMAMGKPVVFHAEIQYLLQPPGVNILGKMNENGEHPTNASYLDIGGISKGRPEGIHHQCSIQRTGDASNAGNPICVGVRAESVFVQILLKATCLIDKEIKKIDEVNAVRK